MSTTDDFETDRDEFDVEPFYAWGQVQHWVVFGEEYTPDELGVYAFLMAHVNPHTGKFDAHFGRKRIAERFGKSVDWVDKRLKALVAKGAMQKKATYWRDAYDHSKGRSVNPTDSSGNQRAQAPNRYRVRMSPPSGMSHPGPINVGEFYRPQRVRERVGESAEATRGTAPETDGETSDETPGEGGAANQRPGSDQGKRSASDKPDTEPPSDQDIDGVSPGEGGAATQRPPQPPHSGPGGRHTAALNTTGATTTGETTTGVSATADVSLRSDVLANDTAGDSAQSMTEQQDQVGNPPHAGAREDVPAGQKSAREEAMADIHSILDRRKRPA